VALPVTHTTDCFGGQSLRIDQSQEGYRYNLDSLLLAFFVDRAKGKRLIELGCGCGVVSLIIGTRFADLEEIAALDCQSEAIFYAQRNLDLNPGMKGKNIRFFQHDWCESLSYEKDMTAFDIVVSNPPWYSKESGRINPHLERAQSKHEINGNLSDWTQAVWRFLKNKGRVFVVFRAERLGDLFQEFQKRYLEIKTLRFVHGRENLPAKSVLVEAVKHGGKGVGILPPLYVYGSGGEYTPEIRSMLTLQNLPFNIPQP
jgi:tRNA1Val (adenine37-N6)-methyltransferase